MPAKSFACIKSISFLSLAENKLSSLDESLFQGLTQLRHLVLRGNQLTKTPNFSENAKIYRIDVSNNRLLVQPQGLKKQATVLLGGNPVIEATTIRLKKSTGQSLEQSTEQKLEQSTEKKTRKRVRPPKTNN